MFLWLTLGVGAACMRPLPRKREEAESVPAAVTRVTRPISVIATLGVAFFLLPTVVLASAGAYTNFQIRPALATLRSGQSLTYTLYATQGGMQYNVTSHTTFSASDPSGGAFVGNVFTAATTSRKAETITGTFMSGVNTGSASTQLIVKP
jgi:hypothetical protein